MFSVMTYEIRDILKSQTPVPTDAASQTSRSIDLSCDPDRRPSSSQYSSRRPSSTTLTGQEKNDSYVRDYCEEFKRPAEDNLTQYQITVPTPINAKFYSLLDEIKPKPTIQLVALSASGRTVALLSQYSFWVFETRFGDPVCSRVSPKEKPKEKKKTKGFGRRSKEPSTQYYDRAFHCAALSDKLLAVGVDDMIMVFSLEEGSNLEQPVFCDEFDHTNPERLKFSPNGEQLVGVLQDMGDDRTQVLIYSTAPFSDPSEITWEDSPYSPNDVAFSADGTMIAICFSPSGSTAEFRILRKFKEDWREFLVQEVELFGKNDKVGLGFTGITLYVSCHYETAHCHSYQGNRMVAMSVDSPSVTDKDCYRIVADQRGKVVAETPKNQYENILSGLKGTDNWAIAVSEYGIALVSKKGTIPAEAGQTNDRAAPNKAPKFERMANLGKKG